MALEALGQHTDALGYYDAAIALSPTQAVAHFNRALCNLTLGDYGEGWPEYEWRWQTEQLKSSELISDKPLWLGKESLRGKRILVHAEQGLGDSLQFCRYLPMVSELGATLIVQVQAPLVPLIRTMRGVAQVVAQGEALPEFDVHCPFMSLPLAFGTTVDTVPFGRDTCRPLRRRRWRGNSALDREQAPRVGLVVGRRAAQFARGPAPRRCPQVDSSGAVRRFEPARCGVLSLQKGEPAVSQLRDLEEAGWDGPAIQDLTAELHDFEDTAALVDQLDLVISVDTSVAHLAGALGKPVWLLNRFDTCWRWMTERDDSPWYPTMKIFRQPVAGDWESVLAQVRAELQSFLSPDSRL